jgi:hypothetical protein
VKTTRLAVLFAAVLGLAAGAVLAQVNKTENVDLALTGKISVVDTVAKTIALDGANGEHTVVAVNDKTTIMSGDKKLKLDGLHKNDWVAVDADRLGATVTATYIEVVDDPTAAGGDDD